jgi:hypothetical protein
MASMIKSSNAVQRSSRSVTSKGPYTGGERLSSISGNHGIPETLQVLCANREIGLKLKTYPDQTLAAFRTSKKLAPNPLNCELGTWGRIWQNSRHYRLINGYTFRTQGIISEINIVGIPSTSQRCRTATSCCFISFGTLIEMKKKLVVHEMSHGQRLIFDYEAYTSPHICRSRPLCYLWSSVICGSFTCKANTNHYPNSILLLSELTKLSSQDGEAPTGFRSGRRIRLNLQVFNSWINALSQP